MNRTARRGSLLVVAAFGVIAALDAGLAQQPRLVQTPESTIRRVATNKTMPVYPPPSIAKKSSGVAVAAIASGPDGRVTDVTMLEAPDDAIAAAVRDALLQWRIPPTTVSGRAEPYGAIGKITFYFRVVGGRGRVFNPEEMPGGPKPEPPGGPPSTPPGARPDAAGPGTNASAPRPAPTVSQHDVPADMEIGEDELRRLVETARPIVLDIRDRDAFKRGHRAGAVNIPRDEISIRSFIELDHTKAVVIDCSQLDTQTCRNVATRLARQSFPKVLIFLP